MFSKMKKSTRHILTALSLCLTLALVLEMAPVRAEELTFDQKVAANGTNFVKLSDDEKTDFLLFGSEATKGNGMRHRWKMLNKGQVTSVVDNETAERAFGINNDNLWVEDSDYSTTSDGQNLEFDRHVSGINLEEIANSMGIQRVLGTKIQFTAIDKSGSRYRTDSNMFQSGHPRYCYESFDAGSNKTLVQSLLKSENGEFSLRIGQEKPTEITKDCWKNNLKTLQIDTVTTATQNYEVVFTANDNGKEYNYVLSNIIDAGQYSAEFAYYNNSNEHVTAEVEGVKLTDVLAERNISLASGDIIYAVDDQGEKTQLKNSLSNYLLAYQGTAQVEGSSAEALTSTSEFCLFGPGSTESDVKINNIYSVTITRKSTPVTPTPPKPTVTAPKATKIVKLTKKKKAITVKWKKVSGVNGYQLCMATKKKGKYRAIKTVKKAGTVKFTKKKLKKGKKYFFKVRTYKTVNGKKYYSPWSAVKYKKL